jgi:RNA polymerase sigma-70 factor, ECF subfamily
MICEQLIRTEARHADEQPAMTDESVSFGTEFQQVSRSAFLLARHLGRSPDEAFDVVQEAALQAWRYRHSRIGSFRSWFLAIVFRIAHRPRPAWLLVPFAWHAAEPAGLQSLFDPQLLVALKQLPVRQRSALWLRYCEDMSTADVARVMRSSETATKQLLLRARTALKRELQSGLGENTT